MFFLPNRPDRDGVGRDASDGLIVWRKFKISGSVFLSVTKSCSAIFLKVLTPAQSHHTLFHPFTRPEHRSGSLD